MNKITITKEEWQKFVAENSTNSYSLVVCLCILSIWEAGCKTEKEAHDELMRDDFGISGVQAEMAIDYALKYDIEKHLDAEMIKIKRDKNIIATEKVIEK